MEILVTGAGGYLGSRVMSDLLQKEHTISGIDNFSNAQVDEVNGEKIHDVDVADITKLEKFFPVGRVIHLAAVTGVIECERERDRAYATNVVGTANIAYLCDKYNVPLLFASSMAIFGETTIPIRENHPRNPLNFYGKTKLMGTEIIKMVKNKGYIFIISNIYGSHKINGNVITKHSVVNKFIEYAKKDRPMKIYRPGTQARNFIHVEDVSKAYCTALNKINGLKEICLASTESLSVNEIAEIVKKHGKKYDPHAKIVENPRKETLVENFEVDVSRLNELGTSMHHNVESEIKRRFEEER
jgi:UDP-glucose 4-epimerase